MQSARPYLRYEPSPDYVEQRLRGTIWERVALAHVLYRSLMAVAMLLTRIGVSANALTYASLLLAAAAGVAAAHGRFATAALLFGVSGVCDVFDGTVARAAGKVSKYGALLDSTVDRCADAMPLIGLIVYYAKSGAIAAVPAFVMLGAFVVSYVRARAEALGCQLPPLFMRRVDRFLLLMASLLLGLVATPASLPAPLMLAALAVLGLMNVVGAVWALRCAHKLLAQS
jgi:CDP-diacylglycerol--glycerol-3-phosphate 3-phosphatidyltransferase